MVELVLLEARGLNLGVPLPPATAATTVSPTDPAEAPSAAATTATACVASMPRIQVRSLTH